jgi:hypothetical protein
VLTGTVISGRGVSAQKAGVGVNCHVDVHQVPQPSRVPGLDPGLVTLRQCILAICTFRLSFSLAHLEERGRWLPQPLFNDAKRFREEKLRLPSGNPALCRQSEQGVYNFRLPGCLSGCQRWTDVSRFPFTFGLPVWVAPPALRFRAITRTAKTPALLRELYPYSRGRSALPPQVALSLSAGAHL